jgi:type II secretory pathway component PulC
MSRHSTVFIALMLSSVLGCEKSKLREEMMEDSTWESSAGDETWEAAGAPSEELAPESQPQAPYQRVSSGTISRGELLTVLDQGLGRFLQNVETEPAFHKGSFVGFRIISLFPGDPAFASLDLRPGDTVTQVNGKPIERPEQAVAVWQDLRTASKLVVYYRRGEETLALRFQIVDEP